MKKLLATIFLVALFVPAVVLATETLLEQGLSSTATEAGLSPDTKTAGDVLLYTRIGQVINIVLGLIGIIMMYFIIYAGYVWMVSEGEAGKIKEAKDRLKNAIFGLVIIALAYSLSNFIIDRFNK